jgi:sulfur dioxygenase
MAIVLEQLFDPESSTYTYLIGCPTTGLAALIDPVLEQVDRDLGRVAAHGFHLVHTLETHLHADHVTGGGELTARTGCKPIVHVHSPVTCEAVRVGQGDRVRIGAIEVEVRETPGHTPDSLSYIVGQRVFTGDALLIGTCGRTDFQGGDAGQLYDSVYRELFTLPDELLVFPAHDYKGQTQSTIGAEKRGNTRLAGRTREEFVKLMAGLGLPPPAKIDVALPANVGCGRPRQA